MTASRLKQREVAQRRAKLLAAASSGMTVAQIADLDPGQDQGADWVDPAWRGHPGRVAQELRRALESAAETDDEIAARFVTLELERLAGMERRVQQIMRQAVADRDGGLALRAVDRLLAVSERRSRLLALDADRSTRNPAGPAPGDGDDADDLAKRRRARRSQARLLAAQRQG